MKKFYVIVAVSLFGVILMLTLKPTTTRDNAEAGENEALRNQLAAAQREVKIAKSQAGRVEIIETRVEVPVEVSGFFKVCCFNICFKVSFQHVYNALSI